MIDIKTADELEIMRIGGQKLGKIRDELMSMVKPGISLLSIESRAQQAIAQEGCAPSFQTVEGYKWATCLCVNDVVVHGIPTDYVIQELDVVTVDVGLIYKGLHTDTAWTKIATAGDKPLPEAYTEFLRIGEETFWKAINVARKGNNVGHISEVIQNGIEGVGYSVVKSLVGHGVGKTLHEEPQIPNYVRGAIHNTPKLVSGMTIAIEIIYTMGAGQIIYDNDDGWTIATKDGSLASVFEHTIAITDGDPLVLTKSD